MSYPVKSSPEELLRHIEEEEHQAARGRLKVFLGYASGVGKSFRMFDEGRRRRERGQDVVIAAMQANNSPELASLMQQLEIIPTRHIQGAEVIDLEQIRARQPEVCLVDGLAHDNPPGCRNAHRWQDVEDLLSAGIAVITTVNLEFVAELQKQVSEIRHKTAATSVPVAFLHKADEVVVVDAPAGYQGSSLKYFHVDAPVADREKQLSQLRELALLLAADTVDKQLEAYLRRNGVTNSWGTQERLLVCLSSRSPVDRMMRRARVVRERFHGPLFAIHVRTRRLNSQEESDLQRMLQTAGDFGAQVIVLDGEDEARAIIEFARKERITQLFVGHSRVQSWRWHFLQTTADRILRAAEGIDVKLFPH